MTRPSDGPGGGGEPTGPPTFLIHPYCGCKLSPVQGWWLDGHGVIECMMCHVTWTEIYPDEAGWQVTPLRTPDDEGGG